ncbi:MAG: UDP-glucose 4-epimerase GalE [Bdellovibrionales bacterium]|nr:UDP-glucose 4-epimerase GalE [Bdellovibrionales bacterium]
MRVLVTGGAGYIGSFVAHHLIEQGHFVVVYDNFSTGFREALHPKCKFVLGDVRDRELPARVLRDNNIDIVMHFAAKLNATESVQAPLEYLENNFLGTLNMLQCCERVGVSKFIFSSTAAVYGDTTKKLVTEQEPLAPINPYGESKYFSERVLFDQSRAKGLSFISLRYFNVSGASHDLKLGQRTKDAFNLIKNACEVVLGKTSALSVFGNDFPTKDGSGVRDYIHVEDLANAHILAAEKLFSSVEPISEIYNCGYGKGYSVFEIIKTFEKISGKPLPYELHPRRQGDPACVLADATKIQKDLNWKAEYDDIEEICSSTLKWFESLEKN